MLTSLLSLLATFILNILHPTQPMHSQVLASENRTSTVPTFTQTITPTPSVKKSSAFSTLAIDCVGPDGKHFFATQKQCTDFNNAWGKTTTNSTTQKTGDHTYTMQFTPDGRMASPGEIFQALNAYRQKNNAGILTWYPILASYAQSRTDAYNKNGKLDEHAGFVDFLNNHNGFAILGFNKIGENAAFAGPLTGTHLIEEVFAGDSEHNTNQLNPTWLYVGIGVNGSYTDIIFASEKR